ncbi:MAG: glycosyltransferase [Candidatus Methylacidiphilales bacterium]|nr:glycosyltransferase [Candidatus Methylacidiphilales bacterium]
MSARILILTAGYGEGHNTAARCLAAGFTHLRPDLQVEVCDPYAVCYGSFNDFIRRLYISAINRTPNLWRCIYWLMDRTPLVPSTQWLAARMERWLAAKLERERPSVICSTFPAYNFTLARIHGDARPYPYVQGTVVTDSISINSLWTKGRSDVYYVPNDDTARVVVDKGLPPSAVAAAGFPVQLALALPEHRLEPPPLDAGRTKVLYILNSGKAHAPQIVRRLLEFSSIDLTLAVGRDEKLRDKLSRLTRGQESRVQFIGWTDQMPQLMMTHHVVITKAGGATVQEALAAGCPLILNQVVPGQEEGNWFLVRDHDCGTLQPDPDELVRALGAALENGGAGLKRWRANILQRHRPDAALRIAEDLIRRAGL